MHSIHTLMVLMLAIMIFVITVPKAECKSQANQTHSSTSQIRLISWKWEDYKTFMVIMLFGLSIVVIKICLQRVPHISEFIPESCILLGLGLLFGCFFKFLTSAELRGLFQLKSDVFFHFLLPPIILEAAYGLHSVIFYRNLVKIGIFAVLGTLLNAALITGTMLAVVRNNLTSTAIPAHMDVLQVAYFSSFIVAVDPVAVLAIFQEIGVNLSLYYLVFGESLFNDAVTVVLYNILDVFNKQDDISTGQFVLGFLSFFTVSLGGALVGLIWGIISCLLTRLARDLETLEPLIMALTAYTAYLSGDLYGWSGLMAIITCGLVHVAYAFHNISVKSVVTVKRATRMLAQLSEAAIFLFLGVELLNDTLWWDAGFVVWTVAITLCARALVVPLLCQLVRLLYWQDKKQQIGPRDQFIMVYGGLRGAVAYALATTVEEHALRRHPYPEDLKGLFLASTLVIVLVTNLIMGVTMRPLVKLLKIQSARSTKWSLFKEFNRSVVQNTMLCLEALVDQHAGTRWLGQFRRFDETCLRPILQREPFTRDEKMVTLYEKVSMAMHMAAIRPNQSADYLGKVPSLLQPVASRPSLDGMVAGGVAATQNVLSADNQADKDSHDENTMQPDLPDPRDPTRRRLLSDPYGRGLSMSGKVSDCHSSNSPDSPWTDKNYFTITAADSRGAVPTVLGKDLFKHFSNREQFRKINQERYDDVLRPYGELLLQRRAAGVSAGRVSAGGLLRAQNIHRPLFHAGSPPEESGKISAGSERRQRHSGQGLNAVHANTISLAYPSDSKLLRWAEESVEEELGEMSVDRPLLSSPDRSASNYDPSRYEGPPAKEISFKRTMPTLDAASTKVNFTLEPDDRLDATDTV